MLPSLRSTRTTTMGYGTKFDFTKTGNKNPKVDPGSYNPPSIFDPEKNKKRGYTISPGREEILFQSFNQQLRSQQNPGPGAYPAFRPARSKYYGATIRVSIQADITSSSWVPGPGNYPVPSSITEDGRHSLSNWRASCVPSLKNNDKGRFSFPVSKLPGPGQYSCEVNVKNGIIYNSKYKSPTYRSFGAALRQSLSVQNTSLLAPGPGAYPVPSEFGVYESKYLHQSQSSGKFPTKKEEKSIVVTS